MISDILSRPDLPGFIALALIPSFLTVVLIAIPILHLSYWVFKNPTKDERTSPQVRGRTILRVLALVVVSISLLCIFFLLIFLFLHLI